ncbi:hypothetical protein ACIP9X_14425 [Arthrobacter sp. NPDC093125]|uniref:hypothetical protein n=1 Tax=Arthrobacter sp. NPDC093125 TaxID=3363944 RepID=UPI00381A27F3
MFARLGVSQPGKTDSLVAAFMVDLENWRVDASTSALALARDVGSVAKTVKITVPELLAEGRKDVVQFECDLDELGRICDLAVKITATDVAAPPLTVMREAGRLEHFPPPLLSVLPGPGPGPLPVPLH